MRALLLLLAIGIAGGLYAWHGYSGAQPLHPDDPRNDTGDNGIVMLAAEWCGYCRRQQRDFEMAGVRYRVLDVDTAAGQRAAQALGSRGIPVTVIGQNVVHGYNTQALGANLDPLGYRLYRNH